MDLEKFRIQLEFFQIGSGQITNDTANLMEIVDLNQFCVQNLFKPNSVSVGPWKEENTHNGNNRKGLAPIKHNKPSAIGI
jgi:hypothetical protein